MTGVSLQAVVPVAKGPAEGGWRALATIPKSAKIWNYLRTSSPGNRAFTYYF